MTWYATEILARSTDLLLRTLLQDPTLAPHTYVVREPIEFDLNGNTQVFSPPPEGLLVVRPICDPDSHCAQWHEEDVVSWASLDHPSTEVLSPETLRPHVDESIVEELPPAGLLRHAKHLADVGKTDLVFFHCFMWGGDTELEYSWSFGSREELSLVVRHDRVSTVARSQSGRDVQLVELDLLSDTLAYLGAPIPSPFWILHTRGFPWQDFRATGRRGDA